MAILIGVGERQWVEILDRQSLEDKAFFSARGYRFGRTHVERAAGLATLAGTTTALAQDWGDMGFSSYTNVAMFAMCYAVGAKLCAATEIPPPQAPRRPESAAPPRRVATEVVA